MPCEFVKVNTPAISEVLEFEWWYQPIWFYEPGVFPEQNKQIAQWLEVAHKVGQAICYWVLPINGITIARAKIQSVMTSEVQIKEVKRLLLTYDSENNRKLNDQEDCNISNLGNFKLYKEDENPQRQTMSKLLLNLNWLKLTLMI
jgi:hypothetical protein